MPKAPSLARKSCHSSTWKVIAKQRHVWCMEKRLLSFTTVLFQMEPLKSLDIVEALNPEPSPLASARRRNRPSSYNPIARCPLCAICMPMAGNEPSSENKAGLLLWMAANAFDKEVLRFFDEGSSGSAPCASSSSSASCASLRASSSAFWSNSFSKPETMSAKAVMMPLLLAPLSRHKPNQSSGGTRKNSLMNSLALEHAVPRTGRKRRKAHSKGQPAFWARLSVIE